MLCVMVAVAMNYDVLTLTRQKYEAKVFEYRLLFATPIDHPRPIKIPESRLDFFLYRQILNDKVIQFPKHNMIQELSKCKCDLSYFRYTMRQQLLDEDQAVRYEAMLFLFEQDKEKSTKIFFACLNDKSGLVSDRALSSISYFGDRDDLFLLTAILNNLKDRKSDQAKDYRLAIEKMEKRLDRVEKESKKGNPK